MDDIRLIDKLKSYFASWANGNVNSIPTLLEICPELIPMQSTPQSKSSHSEGSVARHTILTCEAANELVECIPSKQRKYFRYAALLHDIGKPYCKVEAAPGIISFPDRNVISSRMARIVLDKYTALTPRERENILALINNHIYPMWMIENGCPTKMLERISVECDLEVLYNLSKANLTGSRSQHIREKFEQIEAFKAWCINESYWSGKKWEGILTHSNYRKFGKFAETAKSIVDWFYLNDEIEDRLKAREFIANRERFKWGTLYLTVGPPGSGKSYWIEKKYSTLPVVSTDQLRIHLKGNIADQSDNEFIYNVAHEKVMQVLNDGKRVVLDATNLRRDYRKLMIDKARSVGAQIIVLFFATKYDTCLNRLKKREILPLDEQVLYQMYLSFDYLAPYEYDKIIYI